MNTSLCKLVSAGKDMCYNMSGEYNNLTDDSVFKPASDFRSQLLTIYMWPFVWVLVSSVFGSLGNLIVMYVYALHWQKCKARIFFVMFASLNFVNSIYSMPVEAYILWRPLDFDHQLLCKTSRVTVFVINNICVALFITVAIDRLLLVYKPLRHRMLTVRYAKMCCVACFVIGTATAWPGYVLYGTATAYEEINGVNVTGKTCFISDDLSGLKWPRLYGRILLVLTVVFFITITVMYIFIGRKLYQVSGKVTESQKSRTSFGSLFWSLRIRTFLNSKSRPNGKSIPPVKTVESVKQSGRPDKRSHSASSVSIRRLSGTTGQASRDNTITLLLVTMTYILSFVPYISLVTLRYMHDDFYSSMSKSRRIIYHIFLRFYLFNSTLSPFVFAFSNAKFRQTVLNLFCKRCKKG